MYCVCWCDLDPIQGQGQGHRTFELPTTSEAVHADGDDRSPLAGLSGFFPRLISAVADWCLPHFHTWCDLSANLECRFETCCMWLDENIGCNKLPKNHHLGTIAQLCQAISSQLRHVLTIGKKFVKQQYLLQTSSQYGELGPLTAEINLPVWGTPANFNWFRVLASLLQRHRTP